MDSPPNPDESPINVEIALKRLNDDRALLSALAGFFLEDAPQLLEHLQVALRAEAFPDVARYAHGLRGLAASFEATHVMKTSADIEHLARQQDSVRLREPAARLEREFRDLVTALEAIISQNSVA